MSNASSRLRLYALLSAIEEDLRDTILVYLSHIKESRQILGEAWIRAVDRLSTEEGTRNEGASLNELIPYIDFSDAYAILNTQRENLPPNIGQAIRKITPRLEELAPIRNRVSHGRPLDFDDLSKTLAAADYFLTKADLKWSALSKTLQRIREEPSFVLGMSIPVFDEDERSRCHNLPTPDFDETGFLGRKKQVADLIRLIKGPYPVITVSGEGGVGKTAIALKVAYDLLDQTERPFDAVVWTSSKTQQLTSLEVHRIEGAISDSLGLLGNVAHQLGGSHIQDPLTEVLQYLAEFRILLILDNLETVLDARIRTFLQQLPAGSKVLVTSRIGLGAFEYPYKLESLESGESVQLLRALASARGLARLFKMPNNKLREYCNRMENNPGFIKWFVSAIQAGRRPEEILDQPHVFLDFCMTNVYEYLSEQSRAVLRSILCVPGSHSQAVLAFLNDMHVVELQKALQLLLTTNFVSMTSIPIGSTYESRYALSDLAGVFLSKHHSPSSADVAMFTKRKRQIVAAGEQVRAEVNRNPFSFGSIAIRSPSDSIVARYLLNALEQSRRRDFEAAELSLSTARALAPEYFEVHRVLAIVNAEQENYSAAREAYEAAIELEPSSAPLRFWYGNFLLRYLDDLEESLAQFRAGLEIAPGATEIEREIARVLLYKGEFAEALKAIESLKEKSDSLTQWNKKKLYDLMLVFYQRRSESLLSQREEVGALDDLVGLRETYEGLPEGMADEIMRVKLAKALPTAAACLTRLSRDEDKARCRQVIGWIRKAIGREFEQKWAPHGGALLKEDGERHSGAVVRMRTESGFGFLRSDDGREWFFHRNDLRDPSDWALTQIGARVIFSEGIHDSRPCACEIELAGGADLPAG